jgi:hypothetical protein
MTTVRKLIEFLQSQPQDLRVLIKNTNFRYDDVKLENVIIENVTIGDDYKYPYDERHTDPTVFPFPGEWAWSYANNRWVRLDTPEPGEAEPTPWPVEKALLLS